jgi:hypothetical protein
MNQCLTRNLKLLNLEDGEWYGYTYSGNLTGNAEIRRVKAGWEVVLPFDYVISPSDENGFPVNPLAFLSDAKGEPVAFKTLDDAVAAMESIGCALQTIRAEYTFAETNKDAQANFKNSKWVAIQVQ